MQLLQKKTLTKILFYQIFMHGWEECPHDFLWLRLGLKFTQSRLKIFVEDHMLLYQMTIIKKVVGFFLKNCWIYKIHTE